MVKKKVKNKIKDNEPILSISILDTKKNKVKIETLTEEETMYAAYRAGGYSPDLAYCEVYDKSIKEPTKPSRTECTIQGSFKKDLYEAGMDDYDSEMKDWKLDKKIVRKETWELEKKKKIKEVIKQYQDQYKEKIKFNWNVIMDKVENTALDLLENGSNNDKRDMIKTLLKHNTEKEKDKGEGDSRTTYIIKDDKMIEKK